MQIERVNGAALAIAEACCLEPVVDVGCGYTPPTERATDH